MKKTGKVLNSLEDYILAAMLMVMTILAFINVIMRYVLLSSLPWIEELKPRSCYPVLYRRGGSA